MYDVIKVELLKDCKVGNFNLRKDSLIISDGDGVVLESTVDNFIKETHVSKIGDKTTIVRAVLKNGYEIIETSSCVDPLNYNEEIGKEQCLKKIREKIWELLGFLMHCGKNGFNN